MAAPGAAPGCRTKHIQTQEATKDAKKKALHMSGSRAASGSPEPFSGSCFREPPPRERVGSHHTLAAPGAAPWERGAVFGSRFS